MAPMSQPLHDRVDNGLGLFAALGGEVQVDHGGRKTAVPQDSLDDPQVDACFKEVSRIAMPQRMDRDALFADA